MKQVNYEISGFTNMGIEKQVNQDRILINGNLMKDGDYHLIQQTICYCFIADGVGGNNSGEFAADFVLEHLNNVNFYPNREKEYEFYSRDFLKELHNINYCLLDTTRKETALRGSATTLTGLVISEDFFLVLHAGDSQIWLYRNDIFFKVTQDQVVNELENNSPITNYFGGYENSLHLYADSKSYSIQPGDIYVICSDGLFKTLKPKTAKAIIKGSENTRTASLSILNNCLSLGAEDNVSAILIKCVM
jgi:protein phosphatase